MPACGTKPARAAVVGSVFDRQELRRRSDPAPTAADETEMQVAGPRANLAFPLLPMEVEIGGRGDLGVDLRRRQLLRRPADLRRPLALGDPQGVVDDRGGVDLHGDRIRIGGVQAIEIEQAR